MDTLKIDGKEVLLLEPPHKDNDTPRRILYVLFKHKLLIAVVFLVVSLPALIYALLQPTKYLAISQVMIQPSRAFLNPGPDGGQLRVSPSAETINNEIQIIKSRELIERLVQDVPLHLEENGNGQVPQGEPNINVDAVRIGGRLKVSPVRVSNIIQISLASTNPEWAAQVVNRAAELHQSQHLEVHKTRGIAEFYDQQEKTLQQELTEAEAALKAFQEREKVVDAEKELEFAMGRLASFETNLRTTESAIREINEKIRTLEAQLKEQRENVQAGRSLTTNPVHTRIRDRLVQLELEKNSLLQRYTPKDRVVMDKEKEIAELRDRLASEEKRMMEGQSVSLNSIHDGILNSLLVARSELNALEARRATLVKQVGNLSSEAAVLKKKGYGYDRLQREVNAQKEALALYSKKGEEARISNAMDERKFGNVSIVDKASLPLRKDGLPPLILILAALFLSMAIAVGGAFAIEFFNTSLRDEADVEEQTGLPVLATIQDYRV